MGGTFKPGDRVVSTSGFCATVLSTVESVSVHWDGLNIPGTWPATGFKKLERAFVEGQFVRMISEDEFNGAIGIIIDDDGTDEDSDPYTVFVDDDEEQFSGHEMIPWIPDAGERVIETGYDEDEGTVISCDGFEARVLWDGFHLSQDFFISGLEPAEVDEEDDEPTDFVVGETVQYASPIFSGPIEASIIGFDDVGLRVRFTRDFLPEGNYSKDNFLKAA
jgi:hypothetical protein